jgi:tRNA 2-selenouridine synthase SelU
MVLNLVVEVSVSINLKFKKRYLNFLESAKRKQEKNLAFYLMRSNLEHLHMVVLLLVLTV